MAKSLDGLIHYLVDQIALFGEKGALPSDFICLVKEYYADSESSNVDRRFLEKAWKWLCRHPEIQLGNHATRDSSSLSKAKARNAAAKEARHAAAASQHAPEGGITRSLPNSGSAPDIQPVECAQTLEFHKDAQSNVSYGEAAGQTAESSSTHTHIQKADFGTQLPMKTNDAFKDTAIARQEQEADLADDNDAPNPTSSLLKLTPAIRLYTTEHRMWHALAGHGPDASKIKALDFVCLSMIGACGPKGIYQHELVKLTGQDKRSLPARTDRLHEDGYILKTRTSVQLFQPRKMLHTSHLVLKRFVKELTDYPEQSKPMESHNRDSEVDINEEMTNGEGRSPIPQWTPDSSWSNQIFDLVANSGTKGMTMKDIRENLFGHYVRKPIDEYVTRLVECWQISQPLHLRHLSIIRDTALRGKTNVYIYYTFENFQSLVHLEKAFWDGVKTVPDGATNGINVAAPLDAEPETDEFGFPVLDPDLFQGHDNSATMKDCASALKADRFRITHTDPIVAKQNDGTYAVRYKDNPSAEINGNLKTAPLKPNSVKKRATGVRLQESEERQQVPELASPKHKRPTDLIVKVRGRPRKYPKDGAPADLDVTNPKTMKRLQSSRKMAEKYARAKIENEISSRIEEGGEAIPVTREVLEKVDALRNNDGQPPLSEYSRGMILHTFAGGPKPKSIVPEPLGRGKSKPYWPSLAAHNILVPRQTRKFLNISRNSPQPALEAITAQSRKRRLPARLRESESGLEILPAQKKRRIASVDQTMNKEYLPSIAAHSLIYSSIRPTDLNASGDQTKPKKGRKRRPLYLPSAARHNGGFPLIVPQPKPGLDKQRKTPEDPIQPPRGIVSPANHPHDLQPCQHTSTAAHSAPTLSTPHAEGLYPGWVKYMSKYYEAVLLGMSRPRDGAFVGPTKHRRKRPAEPAEFRPRFFKIVVFKHNRLQSLDWFQAEKRPQSYPPPHLIKGFDSNYPQIRSPLPSTPISNHRRDVAGASPYLWTPRSQPTNVQSFSSPAVSNHVLDTGLRSPMSPRNAGAPVLKGIVDAASHAEQVPSSQLSPNERPIAIDHLPARGMASQANFMNSQISSIQTNDRNDDSSQTPDFNNNNPSSAVVTSAANEKSKVPTSTDSSDFNAAGRYHPTVSTPLPPAQQYLHELSINCSINQEKLPAVVGEQLSMTTVAEEHTRNDIATRHDDLMRPNESERVIATIGNSPLMSKGEQETRSTGEIPIQDPATSGVGDASQKPHAQALETPTVNATSTGIENITVSHGVSTSKRPLASRANSLDGVFKHTSKTTQTQQSKSKPTSARALFPMMTRRGGTVAVLRKKIVMDILEKCEGIFGGHREMTKPFAAEWIKRGQEGTPEDKTLQNTINSLYAEGSLRQIVFAFKTKQGKTVKKEMILRPDITDADPQVKEFQTRMMAYHPAYYLPKALENPEDFVSRDAFIPSTTRADKVGVSKRIKLGKHRAAEATLATMQAQDRARPESAGQQEHESEVQGSEAAAETSNELPESIRRVPHVPHSSPSSTKRPTTAKRPIDRRADRLESSRRPLDMPWLPGLVGHDVTSKGDLLWLPESFAFEEYNYEEDRPTIVEPMTCQDTHKRHARYGNQLTTSNALRDTDTDGPDNTPINSRPRRKHRERTIYSDTINLSIAPKSAHGQLPYLNSAPLSNFMDNSRVVSGTKEQDTETSYVSPYGTEPSLSLPEHSRQQGRSQTGALSQTGTLAGPLNTTIRQKEPLINFMDATHYFHQTTRTFSVGFTGLAQPRHINNRLGTCSKPYSLGPRITHPEFPAPRHSLPKRPPGSGETHFEQEVNASLNWELEHPDFHDIWSDSLPIINYTFHHAHVTAEALDARMNEMMEVLYSTGHGRSRNRKFPTLSEVTAKTGKGKLQAKAQNPSAAAIETLKRIHRQAPMLKRRRLTSLVEKSTQDDGLNATPTIDDHRATKFRRIRGPRDAKSLGPGGEMRLLTAAMVVRTLTGGIDKVTDWELVVKAFEPSYSRVYIRSRWNHVLQKYKTQLTKMEDDFQDLFTDAYEDGSVPSLDYDNLGAYDWQWLVEWAMVKLKTAGRSQPDLPRERSRFDELYEIQDTSKIDINDYYSINTQGQTVANRANLVQSITYVSPITPQCEKPPLPDPGLLSIAKTWIRANVITPEETYNPPLARAKLEKISTDIIDEALKQLLTDKVVSQGNKGRLIPGRNYDVSENLIGRLKKNILPENFQQAISFKQHLDEEFQLKESSPYSSTSSDGGNLAIINLQAHFRIRVVPLNVPANKWGQTDGSYESRHMDKSRLNFQIELRPTNRYIYGNPLLPMPEPPNQHLTDQMSRIPLWYDIHGFFVPVMWNMLLAAVLAILSMRPGVNAEEITKNLTPAVESWEVELVLGWLVDAGAGKRIGDGYMTEEWWWCAYEGRVDKGKGKEKEEVGEEEEKMEVVEDRESDGMDVLDGEK